MRLKSRYKKLNLNQGHQTYMIYSSFKQNINSLLNTKCHGIYNLFLQKGWFIYLEINCRCGGDGYKPIYKSMLIKIFTGSYDTVTIDPYLDFEHGQGVAGFSVRGAF